MNNNYVILADVCCDLSPEVRQAIGMEDYIKGHVHIEGGKDFLTTMEWIEMSREDYYKTVSNKKVKVSTAPPNVEEYYEIFESYVKRGIAILSMSLSSKISSTFDFSCVAAKRIKENYPDANIYCFDSFRMSGTFGLQVIYAHVMKNEGKSMEEVVAWLEENKYRVHQMGPIDDLIFLARRGRITMGKAIMGSFAGVKPMGDCSSDGYTTVITKAKGIAKAFDITIKYIKQTATNIENQIVLISHSNREEYAKMLKEKVEAELAPAKVYMTEVYYGCGANMGPGMIGVYYLGEKVSEDLVNEKAIMSKIVGK